MAKRTRARSNGFGMLEVLVALVLIVSVGVAIITWVRGGVDATIRMRDVYADIEMRQRILEWSASLNPALQPEGKADWGDMRIEWSSSQIEPLVAQTGYPAGIGSFDVGLYGVEIRVFRDDSSIPWLVEKVQQVGFKLTREYVAPFQF